MKIKLEARWTVGLFIFSYIAYIVILAVLGLPNPVYKSSPQYVKYDNDLKPIDPIIPDSISYRKYNELKDSIKTIRQLKNGDFFGANSVYFLTILGTGGNIECDTCSLKWFNHTYSQPEHDKILNTIYCIELQSWKLNYKSDLDRAWTRDSVQFYVEHGQAYIRKFIINKQFSKDMNNRLYRMVNVPVKFRYNVSNQCVMIPVSKTVKHTMDIVLGILDFLFFGYLLILIGYFIGFVIDLSKGLAFTNKNLRTLKRIAYTLLAIPFAELLLNLLLRLIFRSYLTSDVVLNIDVINGYWKFLMFAIIFLMIYRAFRQGKVIKDEQDLTV